MSPSPVTLDMPRLRRELDDPAEAEQRLRAWRLQDPARAHANLQSIADAGVTLDLMVVLCRQLGQHLPMCADPDMALNNLDRFFAATRSPLSLATLLERDEQALPVLLQIFSTSQYLSDLLITDAEAYDLLRITEGQPVARETLVAEIAAEVEALPDEHAALIALRRHKRREILRICYGDFVRGQRLDVVTHQISFLADALLEAALRFARRQLELQRGTPLRGDGQAARFVVLAMGKLGGAELNYSSDIDLVFLFDQEGEVAGPRRMTNGEFFDRLARDVVRLLSEVTPLGQCYRIDLRLRPEGQRGPLVPSLEAACQYYDVLGRTWERQAYVKARAVAGDLDLGQEFLARLEPWIYRRYLSLVDITGIKALKRRIEHRNTLDAAQNLDVKTGHGGIRDVEFVIQFLQLLNGGDLPELRTGNTLAALASLEQGGCLTSQERGLLEENYVFLRNIEHRLQILYDLQTHRLPDDPAERRKLALRCGYVDDPPGHALAAFDQDLRSRTELTRTILNHLLHDAFSDDAETAPETDLVLDPDPDQQRIVEVLSRYPFRDVPEAYRHLMSLATEKIRFLSTRRCRHFLAAIAPQLLQAIAATPDPDSTLVNLAQVSDSLGGKGVLWELFSFNGASLRLYVDLCAYSPYLSAILVSNPGMIDELMDSLELNQLPSLDNQHQRLVELCHAAEDLDPILHSFKNGELLRIGVRDIQSKEDVRAIMAALSGVAEVCLQQIAHREYQALVEKLGQPVWPEGPLAGQPLELVIVALGKFGGAELNYHSDLDLVFLYEEEGQTVPRSRRGESTSHQHFFSELGQRIIKVASHLGPYGRLYEIDPRLRPTGRSGTLATSLPEFTRYFDEEQGQLWERLALCRARVVHGPPAAAQRALQAIHAAAYGLAWSPQHAGEILDMRLRLQQSASSRDFKRGPGGIVDIEFLVQMLQLRYGSANRAVRQPNTLDALAALRDEALLAAQDAQLLIESYLFLRALEGRLRLLDTSRRHDLPTEPAALARLAHMLELPGADQLLARLDQVTRAIRACFERHFAVANPE